MTHLCTLIVIDPQTAAVEYRARCGFHSRDRRQFAKIAGVVYTTLAGVDCPECQEGKTCKTLSV